MRTYVLQTQRRLKAVMEMENAFKMTTNSFSHVCVIFYTMVYIANNVTRQHFCRIKRVFLKAAPIRLTLIAHHKGFVFLETIRLLVSAPLDTQEVSVKNAIIIINNTIHCVIKIHVETQIAIIMGNVIL